MNENNSNKAPVPVVIGKLKKKKQLGPVFVIIFFGILIIFAIFLPTFSEMITKYLNGNIDTNAPRIVEEEKNEQKNISQNEPIYYDIKEDTIIELSGLKFSGFIKNNNSLTFNVENNKNSEFDLKKTNIFIELYSKDNTLIERIMLISNTVITPKEIKSISLNISSSSIALATKLSILEIKKDDYPATNLAENEEKISTLTCINDDNTIQYEFKEQKLTKIDETEATSIGELEKSYANNTQSKVIKFELEAIGYRCN